MSVIISHLSRLISIQDQVEEIIAAADGHKDPYLNTLDMNNSENHLPPPSMKGGDYKAAN